MQRASLSRTGELMRGCMGAHVSCRPGSRGAGAIHRMKEWPIPPSLPAGFVGTRLSARPLATRARAVGMPQIRATASGYQWLKKEPIVILAGFLGYVELACVGSSVIFGPCMSRSRCLLGMLHLLPWRPALGDNSTGHRLLPLSRETSSVHSSLSFRFAVFHPRRRWFAPSNIGVPALGGKSLFGLFSESIGQELSHFPVGPALTDNFWLYLVTWHVGLFLTLFLGQIGVRGRAQGYFD